MWIFKVTLILIVIAMAVVFSLLNADYVMINYYLGKSNLPLSTIVIGSLITGAFIGFISNIILLMKLKVGNMSLEKRLEKLKTKPELSNFSKEQS